MKIGMRKPSLKRSIKARTTGKLKRKVKKAVNPFYGKKGMGWIKNPKKAMYNKIYNKTTFGVLDIAKVVSPSKSTRKNTATNKGGMSAGLIVLLVIFWPVGIGYLIYKFVAKPRNVPAQPVVSSVAQSQLMVPDVAMEKQSKIVSIFTKKWSTIAYGEFIVLDLETTGLDKTTDSIVEIAAIRYVNGIEQDKYVTLVNPQRPIPADTIAIHNITNQMVSNAPTLQQIMPSFLSYLGESVLVGHNANFDIGFVEVWARRHGYNPSWNYVDTISVAKKVIPDLPNYKQHTILDSIGYSQNTYHRAEDDCRGCAEIMLLGLNSVVGTYQ